MSSKKVPDLIIDKFAESITKDDLFGNICGELNVMIKERRHNKEEIENLLKRKQNENSRTEY